MRGQLIWGALYDDSRCRRFLAVGDQAQILTVAKPGGFNQFVIRCMCRRIQIWLNSYQSVDYTETDKSIEQRGLIGLQIHSGSPSESCTKRFGSNAK